jgi:O-antigen biosynthesis protein
MNEAYRVLAPGGFMFVEVPSTEGRGAYQDPTHVSFWNSNSFWYWTDNGFHQYIRPLAVGKFQKLRLENFFASQFHDYHRIPYVRCDLVALKPPYSQRHVGEVAF